MWDLVNRIRTYELIPLGEEQSITAGELSLAAFIIIAGLLASGLIQRIIGRRLTLTLLTDEAANDIRKLIFYTLAALALLAALSLLHVPWSLPLIRMSGDEQIQLGQVVMVALLLTGGFFASRIIESVVALRLRKSALQPDAAQAIQRLLFYSLIIVIAVTALSLLHVPLTAFAFISGAVAIGVGFGAQNIINNFISGWILMTERPVRIGDFVEVEGSHGTIETIGNRSTRIRRVDGVHMLVPNSKILENTVVNWTLVDLRVRTKVSVGVAYGSPVRKVEELIRQAVEEQEPVLKEPRPSVIFEDFGDNALGFESFFWCEVSGERELRAIRSDIRFRITELFEDAGVVIAFPQRDVHLDADKPFRIELVGKERPETGEKA